MENLSKRLSNWIVSKVIEAKAQGVVFGLSGGIDSAVVGILCKKVYDKNTLALIMPCQSTDQDIKDALEITNRFEITYKIIDLSEIYNSFVSLLNNKKEKTSINLFEANIKSRLRMITLYYFANKLNYLVVGTGNKSELAVGYFTKYGDGGVDILPLGSLLKSQVKELAEYLEAPQAIIQKPPSGGLWEGQTDEGEMGISYHQLDEYLKTGQLKNQKIEEKIKNKILLNEHKRNTPAIPEF